MSQHKEGQKKKSTLLSASRGSNRWDVKQKQRKESTLSAKLWKTEITFMVEKKCGSAFLLYTDEIFQHWKTVICDVRANVVCIALNMVV